jgi:hypothetical protein
LPIGNMSKSCDVKAWMSVLKFERSVFTNRDDDVYCNRYSSDFILLISIFDCHRVARFHESFLLKWQSIYRIHQNLPSLQVKRTMSPNPS